MSEQNPLGAELLWHPYECLEERQRLADELREVYQAKLKVEDEARELRTEVERLSAQNRLLLAEHKAGRDISRHSSNESWRRWVAACDAVDMSDECQRGIVLRTDLDEALALIRWYAQQSCYELDKRPGPIVSPAEMIGKARAFLAKHGRGE